MCNTSLGQVVRTTLCCNVFLFNHVKFVNHILVLKFYKLEYTCCCQEHTEQKIKNFINYIAGHHRKQSLEHGGKGDKSKHKKVLFPGTQDVCV